jgi:hypothetical protein
MVQTPCNLEFIHLTLEKKRASADSCEMNQDLDYKRYKVKPKQPNLVTLVLAKLGSEAKRVLTSLCFTRLERVGTGQF